MKATEIIGKHATRTDVPYIVHHPGEGSFVVGPELVVKIDGIREVSKITHAPVRDGGYSFYALRIVRKHGVYVHQIEDRAARDWTYQLIVQLIEGRPTTAPTVSADPESTP